jgi:hypothetical protein
VSPAQGLLVVEVIAAACRSWNDVVDGEVGGGSADGAGALTTSDLSSAPLPACPVLTACVLPRRWSSAD